MSTRHGKEKFSQALMDASPEINGRCRISCAKAFKLALKNGVSIKTIGKCCNENGIKISSCQLGLFK
jgi:hypothetical protein